MALPKGSWSSSPSRVAPIHLGVCTLPSGLMRGDVAIIFAGVSAVAGIHGQDQVLVGIERATLRKMKAAVDRDVVRHRSPRSCLAERADGLAGRKLLGSSWGHQDNGTESYDDDLPTR